MRDELPEILRATRDAVFAAERLVLPESLQHINLSSIPRYTRGAPLGARHGLPAVCASRFSRNANGAVYTIRIMGLLVCPMHYSNPAVLAEAGSCT